MTRDARRRLAGAIMGALIACTWFPVGAASGGVVRTLAAFDPDRGQHPENLTVSADGTVFVSLLDSGLLYRRAADGTETYLEIGAGPGASLRGLAWADGDLLVGVDRLRGGPKAIWRVEPTTGRGVSPVDLPDDMMVNGIAVDAAGRIYAADSANGVILRAPPIGGVALPWFDGPDLAPDDIALPGASSLTMPVGPNGIRIRGDVVYVSVSGQGTLIAVPVAPDGAPGRPEIVLTGIFVDDFAFEANGAFVVTYALGPRMTEAIGRVAADGTLVPVTDGLAQPSSVVIDPSTGDLLVTELGLSGPPARPTLDRIAGP